jgi:hypothetical protein
VGLGTGVGDDTDVGVGVCGDAGGVAVGLGLAEQAAIRSAAGTRAREAFLFDGLINTPLPSWISGIGLAAGRRGATAWTH